MSEYQYYEFQAIDRPLTKDEMARLRQLSSRATITPTRFVNVYNWGDFRGSPEALMETYFDAFVYVANWGTHRLMLRLPRRLLDPETVAPYCACHLAEARAKGDYVILDLTSDDEEDAGWVDDDEAQGWEPALLPLRAELAEGDLRVLYLGWLLCAQYEELDDDALEPPVPPGLRSLTAPLKALADFLRIDPDLLAVAARRSAPLREASPAHGDLERWVASLGDAQKNELILRAVDGDAPNLRAELLRRFREASAPALGGGPAATEGARTVAELRAEAERHAEKRSRVEAEREARVRARREREAALARAKYLDDLAPREAEVWQEVDSLIEASHSAAYERAVELLKDLRDLAARAGHAETFQSRLGELRARYPKRVGLRSRLKEAGL